MGKMGLADLPKVKLGKETLQNVVLWSVVIAAIFQFFLQPVFNIFSGITDSAMNTVARITLLFTGAVFVYVGLQKYVLKKNITNDVATPIIIGVFTILMALVLPAFLGMLGMHTAAIITP